ncbi:MAG TPA: ATP-binding cassette domain-containing protein [Microthrixaceae bacterium]|nr:ATP-binding cassette domain-containing protein [Microthrixaceae bacterium]
MLEIRDLSVSYGHAPALLNVELTAPRGELTVLTGPNGAGKSSLLGAINGSIASTGTVLVDGLPLSGGPRTRLRAGVGYVPQGRQIFPRLTVQENLQVMVRAAGIDADAVDTAMDRFPILRTRARALAGVLSGGEQQMLAVTRALMSNPSVLLLDEMATGLAPRVVGMLLATAVQLAGEGIIVLMAEPNPTVLGDSFNGGYVLRRGEIVDGYAEDRQALQSRYTQALGLG